MRHPGFFAMLWSAMDPVEIDAPVQARRRGGRRGTRGVPPEATSATAREKALKRARRQGVALWTA